MNVEDVNTDEVRNEAEVNVRVAFIGIVFGILAITPNDAEFDAATDLALKSYCRGESAQQAVRNILAHHKAPADLLELFGAATGLLAA